MKKLTITIVVVSLVVGIAGAAIAYYGFGGPMFGGPMFWGMGGPHAHAWIGEAPAMGGRGPFPYAMRCGRFHAWNYRWSFMEERISKATGIPAEKIREIYSKNPLPPRLFITAIALSELLKKDLKEVVSGLSANPYLYISKSGVTPSQLMEKEWEIMRKIMGQ